MAQHIYSMGSTKKKSGSNDRKNTSYEGLEEIRIAREYNNSVDHLQCLESIRALLYLFVLRHGFTPEKTDFDQWLGHIDKLKGTDISKKERIKREMTQKGLEGCKNVISFQTFYFEKHYNFIKDVFNLKIIDISWYAYEMQQMKGVYYSVPAQTAIYLDSVQKEKNKTGEN